MDSPRGPDCLDSRPVPAGAFARFADRWIYVFMTALFFAVVLVGMVSSVGATFNGG